MKKTFGDYLAIFIGVIGSIATLIGFYQTYYKDLNDQGKYGVIFLGIISMYFLGTNIFLVTKYRRKVSYADMFESLNYGFSKLHSLERSPDIKVQEIVNNLKQTCTFIADSFKEAKGHNIAVCIKLIQKKNNDVLVVTLARDDKSSTYRPTASDDKIHRLSENSDFSFIYDNISSVSHNGYFISNNLPSDYDYSNTRLKAQSQKWPPPKFLFLNWLLRQLYWPLKYKSTIVVPIIPLHIEERNEEKLCGFLCIDSPNNNTFNDTYDVTILKGLADGIYNKIIIIRSQIITENGKQ